MPIPAPPTLLAMAQDAAPDGQPGPAGAEDWIGLFVGLNTALLPAARRRDEPAVTIDLGARWGGGPSGHPARPAKGGARRPSWQGRFARPAAAASRHPNQAIRIDLDASPAESQLGHPPASRLFDQTEKEQ